MSRQFTELTEKTARPQNHINRCSASLTTRKMQKRKESVFPVACSCDAGEMGTLDLPGGNVSLIFLENSLVCYIEMKNMPIANMDSH